MTLQQLITAFNEALFDTDRNRALQGVREAVKQGITPEEVVFEVVVPALERRMTVSGESHNRGVHVPPARVVAEAVARAIRAFGIKEAFA